MGVREELINQYSEWLRKYVEADRRLKEQLPKVAREGEKLIPSVITPESLTKFENVEKEVEEARKKMREIMEKLSQLQPEKN